ncbi:MAG: hypothetical protein WCB18_04050 [Thermoplasmata archaeon]
MANRFGSDILIQVPDPIEAAALYVKNLGVAITDERPDMISLHGDHINFFIERGPAMGPAHEVMADDVAEARGRIVQAGGVVIKDGPEVLRCYVKDPFGLNYNLTT